jgi:hypothetical protein
MSLTFPSHVTTTTTTTTATIAQQKYSEISKMRSKKIWYFGIFYCSVDTIVINA